MMRIVFIALLIWALGAPDSALAQAVSDSKTTNPRQNKLYRDGEIKYSAKPKDMWELGLHAGHFLIDGDVDPLIPAGCGFGIHVRRALFYAFSVRADLYYGIAKGIDPQPTEGFVAQLDVPGYPAGRRLHRAYMTKYYSMSFQGILNIGNVLFHKPRNDWNWYLFVGAGVNVNNTFIDAYNGEGEPYDYSALEGYDINKSDDRKKIVDIIKNDIHDGDYETEARLKSGAWHFNDETPMHLEFQGGVGLSRKINQRINIGIEHQVMASDNDLLDGFVYRTDIDQSNNVDISHYTSIRVGINIGDFNKRTEPLYWMNPLSRPLGDIADLKTRPAGNLKDSDEDGVVDMFDQEPNTPAGVAVDTRGVTLDSDSDGIPDYKDKEPFSPPGYDVDKQGIAKVQPMTVPVPDFDQDQVDAIVNERIARLQADWFLPMIRFDLDKYNIKPEFYPQLHQVATVMINHGDVEMVVKGYSDIRSNQAYNKVLSYKRANEVINYLVDRYGISRDRFVLQYGGEDVPIVPNLPDQKEVGEELEFQHYLNRRVEFKVATVNDKSMPMPDGPTDVGRQDADSPGSTGEEGDSGY